MKAEIRKSRNWEGAEGLPPANSRILAMGEYASNDTKMTNLNNNDMVIGPTGAGKTRRYVKPNLLQMNESVIVTDTKGSLVKEVGPALKAHGYRVYHIDFTNLEAGNIGYNPLDYVRTDESTGGPNEQDIMTVSNALCPAEDLREPFWDFAARMVLSSLIGYVMEYFPAEEHTLEYVLKLESELGTGVVEQLMKEAGVKSPDSFAVKKWNSFSAMRTADKMYASIIGILAEKLDVLTFEGALRLYRKKNRVVFKTLGQSKTALFLTVSDTDRSMDKLIGLFYTQALQALCTYADNECTGSALPVSVRLYLDDFATNYRIENFDKIISVIRSRNIAVSIILQSISQLETLYAPSEAKTIINGCDHLLYLGGQDIETAQFVATKANKMMDTILNQPIDRAWLFERGKRGKTVQQYNLTSHEFYFELDEEKYDCSEARR